MAHPYAAVEDDAKREELCTQLWGEIQSAASTIGRRTLTSVLTDIIDRSPTTATRRPPRSPRCAQVARKKSTPTVTPAKKPAGPGSHSAGKRKPLPL